MQARNSRIAVPQSFVSLVARLAAATVFWQSGQTKVDGFLHIRENTFYLFREEYKVPLLPPDLAAYIATAAEHVFPVLLVIGLASRLSALALLGMTAVIQLFVYPDGWPEHLLWATALLVDYRTRSGRALARSFDLARQSCRPGGRSLRERIAWLPQVVLGATVLAALALVVQAQPKSSFLSDTRQPAALGMTEATVSAGKGSLASLPSARLAI